MFAPGLGKGGPTCGQQLCQRTAAEGLRVSRARMRLDVCSWAGQGRPNLRAAAVPAHCCSRAARGWPGAGEGSTPMKQHVNKPGACP